MPGGNWPCTGLIVAADEAAPGEMAGLGIPSVLRNPEGEKVYAEPLNTTKGSRALLALVASGGDGEVSGDAGACASLKQPRTPELVAPEPVSSQKKKEEEEEEEKKIMTMMTMVMMMVSDSIAHVRVSCIEDGYSVAHTKEAKSPQRRDDSPDWLEEPRDGRELRVGPLTKSAIR